MCIQKLMCWVYIKHKHLYILRTKVKNKKILKHQTMQTFIHNIILYLCKLLRLKIR